MKLSRQSRFPFSYTAMAFLLPFAGLLLWRLIRSIAFNGDFSMLYSDCYHQYFPFFKAYREALLSGESLLYSWDVGMGMDYLGLISYYLASPLNLLSVLVPEGWMLGYFSVLMPIKLGGASLAFAFFLKKLFNKDDFSLCLFGCFYGLCAWALGYQWNIMWLDTFALLPLVMLGMVSMLRHRKFVLYTVSLFLSIWSNYYIGFFVCIFVLLSFICYEICRFSTLRRFFGDLMYMALFSAIAIGMTALLSIPTLAALQTTQSSVNAFPEGFRLNIADENTWKGLFDAMRQVAGNANGGIEPTFKEGLPNLYCGVITNVLAILFLTCRQVKLRDKLCCVFMLLFFNISFVVRQLDFIWHGFHFTNMIPYRFSFLYSFVALYMAYRAWLLRKGFRVWQLITALVLSLGLVACSESFKPFLELLKGEASLHPWGVGQLASNLQIISSACSFVLYNVLFILATIAFLWYELPKKQSRKRISRRLKLDWLDAIHKKRRITTCCLLAAMGVELIMILVNFGIWYSPTDVSNYPKGKEDAANVVEYMQQAESDNLFYRAETAHTQTLNDGALNGYNGISTFTSSANVNVTRFMQALGYGAKDTYNRYSFEESSPVANLFLNLKYMIERDGSVKDNPYFDDVYSSGNVHLLENNAYLPLGFLANTQLLNTDFALECNRFTFQNMLMRNATGIAQDCYHLLPANCVTIYGSDVILESRDQAGHCSYKASSGGTVTYRCIADREGLMCFYVEQSKRNSFSVTVNSSPTALYSESYSLPQMLSVCQVQVGDVVEIRFNCKNGESGNIQLSAAILDEDVFRRGQSTLAASTLELTSFSTTKVEGSIHCNRDGVLYTSIPQDGNWTATVDGAPAQIVKIGGTMVGLNLSEGDHTIVFQYQNRAFSLGWKISLACALVFVGLYFAIYQPKVKGQKGKYQK